jgi:hypothetical protein
MDKRQTERGREATCKLELILGKIYFNIITGKYEELLTKERASKQNDLSQYISKSVEPTL